MNILARSEAYEAVFGVGNYPLKDAAILDSGTTLHIFNDEKWFRNIQPAPLGDYVQTGSNIVSILGYGDIELLVNGHDGTNRIRLCYVAYSDAFACNLVLYEKLKAKRWW